MYMQYIHVYVNGYSGFMWEGRKMGVCGRTTPGRCKWCLILSATV